MNENVSAKSAFDAMDNAVDNFFGAINDMLGAADKIENSKMTFVETRTEHYKGEEEKGTRIIECFTFEGLKNAGFTLGKGYQRAKFVGNHGRDYKNIEEMSVGTILKLEPGHYLQRVK